MYSRISTSLKGRGIFLLESIDQVFFSHNKQEPECMHKVETNRCYRVFASRRSPHEDRFGFEVRVLVYIDDQLNCNYIK